MARPTVALVLRTAKMRDNGEAPVWLRVTHARRSRFYTDTGVIVKPVDWNENKKQVRASHPNKTKFNIQLEDLQTRAQAAALTAPSAEAVLAALDGSASGAFSDFFDRYLARLERGGQVWEEKKYRTLKRKLTAALGWPLTWGDLTPDRLDAFGSHLRTKAKNGANTVRKEFDRLRRVVRLAIREGELAPGADPFIRFDLPKSAPVERRRLTHDEVQSLIRLGPDNGVRAGTRLAAVRDLFAIQFYGAGIRVSDALQLTPANFVNDRLTYTMMKTGHAQDVRLPPAALKIVARLTTAVKARDKAALARYGSYLVPMLKRGDDSDPVGLRRRISSASAVVNKRLKVLAERAGLDPDGLSSHVARHSFADYARQSGDLFAVSKALGHSALATTQVYLASFDRTAVDKLTDAMWDE